MDTLSLKSAGNGEIAEAGDSSTGRAGGTQQYQSQPQTPRPSISMPSSNNFQSQQPFRPQQQSSSFASGGNGGSFMINSNNMSTQPNENGNVFSGGENLNAGDQNNNATGINSMAASNLSLLSLPTVLHFIQSEWARFDMERNQWEALQAEMEARIALLQGERTSLDKLKNDLVRRIKMLECALRQERLKNLRLAKQAEMCKNTSGGAVNAATGAAVDAAVDNATSQDSANSKQKNDALDIQSLRMCDDARISKIPNPSAVIGALTQLQQQQQQAPNQQQQQGQANGVNSNKMNGGGIVSNAATDNATTKGWDFKEGRFAIQQYLKELNYTDAIINIRTARLKTLCGASDTNSVQLNNINQAVASSNNEQQHARFFDNNNQQQQQYNQQHQHATGNNLDSFHNNIQQQQEQQHASFHRNPDANTDFSNTNTNNNNNAASADELDNDAETSAALREFEFLSENDNSSNRQPQQPFETVAYNGINATGEWASIEPTRLDDMKNQFIEHRLAQYHAQHGELPESKRKRGPQVSRRETLVNQPGGAQLTMETGGFDSNAEKSDADAGNAGSDNNISINKSNPGTTSALQQAFRISIGQIGENVASSNNTGGQKLNTSFGDQPPDGYSKNSPPNFNDSLLLPTSPTSPSGGVAGGVAGSSLIAIDMEDDDENDETDNVFDGSTSELGFRGGGLHGKRGFGGASGKRAGGRQSDAGTLATGASAAERRVKWRGLYALSDHVDVCRAVCFHPSDLSFVSCSDDCTVKLWTLWTAAATAAAKSDGAIDATITPNSRKCLVPYTTLADAKELQAKSSVAVKTDMPMGTSGLLALMPDRHADFGPHVTLKTHRYPVIACAYAASSALSTSAGAAAAGGDITDNPPVYDLLFTADISGNIRAWNLDRLMAPSSASQPHTAVQKDGACNDNCVDLQQAQAAELSEIHTDAVWTLLFVPPVKTTSDTASAETTKRRKNCARLISVDCQSQLVMWTIKPGASPGPNKTVSIEVEKQCNIREVIHAVDVNGAAAIAPGSTEADAAAAVEPDISLSTTQQHRLLLADELVGVVAADERCDEVLACFRSSGCYLINPHTGKLVRQLKLAYGESIKAAAPNSDAELDRNWDILSCASHAPSQLGMLGHRNGKVTAVFLGSTADADSKADNTDTDAASSAVPTSIIRAQWQAQLQDVVALGFDRNGERLLTGASDGAIRLWSTYNWHCIQDIKESRPKFNEAVTSVCVHAQQPMLASGSADGVIRIYTPY